MNKLLQGDLSENIYRVHNDGKVQVPNKIFTDKTKVADKLQDGVFSSKNPQKDMKNNIIYNQSEWKEVPLKKNQSNEKEKSEWKEISLIKNDSEEEDEWKEISMKEFGMLIS